LSLLEDINIEDMEEFRKFVKDMSLNVDNKVNVEDKYHVNDEIKQEQVDLNFDFENEGMNIENN
jgi:hypothetical protein